MKMADAEILLGKAGIEVCWNEERTCLNMVRIVDPPPEGWMGSIGHDRIEISGCKIGVLEGWRNGRRVGLADDATIEKKGEDWIFSNRISRGKGRRGGIRQDSELVRYLCSSLGECLDAAVRFYTGEPVIVGGWVVPIHRHPSWNIELIRNALANVTTVTAQEFYDVIDHEEQAEILRRRDEWQQKGMPQDELPYEADVSYFVLHHESTNDKLMLRQDCSEIIHILGEDEYFEKVMIERARNPWWKNLRVVDRTKGNSEDSGEDSETRR